MQRRWHAVIVRGMMALSISGVAGACAGGDGKTGSGPDPIDHTNRLDWGKPAALTMASTCDEALTAFRTAARTQMELELEQTKRCYLSQGGCYRMMEDSPAAEANGAPKDDATPDEYSETNTQVQGVDEADAVKTDGTHIYALYGNELVILNSWPAVATNVVGRVKLPGSWSYGIYLSGKTVVALSAGNRHELMALTDRPADGEPYDPTYWRYLTIAATIDVTNPAAPVVTSQKALDGWVMQSRRIGDKVYLALNEWIYIPGLQTWPSELPAEPTKDQIEATFAAMHAANVAVIETLDLTFWLPRQYAFEANGLLAKDGTELTRCADVYIPSVHSGQSLLTVATFDIDDASVKASTVQGEWGNVYASTDAFYVAATDWGFYWYWEATPGEAPPLTTHIHKFAFGDDGVAHYTASGAVEGYAINSYAFDEYDGNLRVATTDGFGWWRSGETTTESRVTVLGESGGKLVEKGVVAGLGKGEQIYAVRFAGTKGYVVTFRQVDPLYVLDLANPAAPKIAGELKIEGFSSYIHPLDAGHLLTVGRDANAEGQVKGLKLEIFDVTDPTAPASVTRVLIGDDWGTWSEAQYDPHAFQYFAARSLLAIPVSGWAPVAQGSDTWEYHSDLFVFKVSNTAIAKLGTVSHVGLLDQLGVNTGCRQWWGWNVAYISRGLFIEDYVYSISNLGVLVHDTRDLAAGAVAEVLVVDGDSWNGGSPYYDPCTVEDVPADGEK